MKKWKKLFIISVLAALSGGGLTAQVPAMPVFDPTNWLVAIDTLYSTYDQIMNTIEQVENQYLQIEQAIKEAASWKLDEIEWDGDLDFRNEIKSVTNSVNKQISTLKSIEDNLTVKQIKIGGYSGTIADLVNPSGKNNLVTAVTEVYAWGKNEVWKTAAAGFTGNLTPEQKAAIASKYGLSPENYFYVQTKKKQLNEAIEKASLLMQAEAFELKAEALQEELQAVMDMAFSEGDESASMKALAQGQLIFIKTLITQINQLETAYRDAAGLTAAKTATELADKEAKQAEIAQMNKDYAESHSRYDALFMSGAVYKERPDYSGEIQ